METYEDLAAGGEHGPAFVPGKSDSSRMVLMMEGKLEPRMPNKGEPLDPAEIAIVRRWIDAGASGPRPGELLAAGSDELSVPSIKPAIPVLASVADVAFDSKAERVAIGSYKTVHLLDVNTGRWLQSFPGHVDLVRAVVFSPDGRFLAAGGGSAARFGEIKIWDVEQAKVVSTMRGHTDAIYSLSFSPDGKTLASASYDHLIKLWDVTTGRETKTLKEHVDAVYSIAFLPDGKVLVSAGGDRTVKIWNVQSGLRLVTMSEPLDAVYTVAVHPSGRMIAAAGADKLIRIWSWSESGGPGGAPGATLLRSTFAHGDSVLKLAFSKDGKMLASTGADRLVKIWDPETLRETQALEIQPDWALGLAIAPDGKWLAAGRYDGTVGIYDLAGHKAAQNLTVP
jgi:WD40 repeat protein